MSDLLSSFFADELPLPPPKKTVGRGGARPHTGPKKGHVSATDETPDDKLTDHQRYERARALKEQQLARKEKVAADLAERSVVYVEDVEIAAARAFSACSASLDSIGDALEREGFDPELCEKVSDIINRAKQQLMADLEKTYVIAVEEEVDDAD